MTTKNSKGNYGGVVIMWDQNLLVSLFSFEGEGYLGVQFFGNGSIIYVINVYSSFHIMLKRKLMAELIRLKSSLANGEWCI